jgi:hypothetical protein
MNRGEKEPAADSAEDLPGISAAEAAVVVDVVSAGRVAHEVAVEEEDFNYPL